MRKLVIAALLALTPSLAFAQTAAVQGEVTKINASGGKITLKHGPIANLDMDGMTMVFALADPSFAGKVKVGDKVTFEADRVNGRLTVVKIDRSK